MVSTDLLVNSQGQGRQLQNLIFPHFIQLMSFSIAHLMGQKLCTSSPNFTLPCQIYKCFASQGDLNALQRKKIPENQSAGKISNILTTSFRYHGLNKHLINSFEIKSFNHTKILLISYLHFKSHVTGAIFTMKTISIHYPPKG